MSLNTNIARRINQWAAEVDVPLVVTRTRTEQRTFAGDTAPREVAIFTIAMPDLDDPDERMTTECTGHQLRYLWAGIELGARLNPTWLEWDRAAAAGVAS